MLTSGHVIRRQDPPVTMTIALPHRLHGVFVEGAKKASMPLGMYVVQMIEAAWAERCGVAKAAPVEMMLASEDEAEKLKARIVRLEKELDRRTSNPADYRYWEGRYRDEAAENQQLKDLLQTAREWGELLPCAADPFWDTLLGARRPVILHEEITAAALPAKALKPETPAKEISPPARKLAPVEVRSIKGLLAAGMNTREITKEYGYTAAQIAAARGQS